MGNGKSPFGFTVGAAPGAGSDASQAQRDGSLARSVGIGTLGFGAASLLVFGSWAWMGRWLYGALGEAGTYAVWAVVFVGVAGAGLRRLLIFPVSLPRFLGFFLVAFGAYALVWSVSWFARPTRLGEWLASLLGTMSFCAVLCWAFGAWRMFVQVALAVFALHSAGYFAGGWLHGWVLGGTLPAEWLGTAARADLSKLLWGAAYGCGFGAGLGYAFHACQRADVGAKLKG